MDNYLTIEDLGPLTAVLGERIGVEGTPTRDERLTRRKQTATEAEMILADVWLAAGEKLEACKDTCKNNDVRSAVYEWVILKALFELRRLSRGWVIESFDQLAEHLPVSMDEHKCLARAWDRLEERGHIRLVRGKDERWVPTVQPTTVL